MSTVSAARPVNVRTEDDLRATIAKRTYSEGGCLIWAGGVDKDGYPKIRIDSAGRARQVHRIHWALEIGPVPDGFQLARLSTCPNRRCIAPAHLVLTEGSLTAARTANSRRVPFPTFRCAHDRTQDNTLKEGGCRTCRLAYLGRYNATRPGRSKLIDTPMPFFGSLR